MTDKYQKEKENFIRDLELWMEGHGPTTIILDAYGGCYSGGRWVAFPLEHYDVPKDITGEDGDCFAFWELYRQQDKLYGTGDTPGEALHSLTKRVQRVLDGKPPLEEDENQDIWNKVEDIPFINPERRISPLIQQLSGTIPMPTQEEIDSDPRLKAILDL